MLIGLLAGALTTGCWVPQLVRSIRTRNVDSFSWAYLITISTGIALWFCYGVIRRDVDIMLPNGLSFVAVVALTALKARITLRARVERLAPVPAAISDLATEHVLPAGIADTLVP